jgi:hypothetical protein
MNSDKVLYLAVKKNRSSYDAYHKYPQKYKDVPQHLCVANGCEGKLTVAWLIHQSYLGIAVLLSPNISADFSILAQ